MTDYPYMLSNNKILPIIQSLQSAAKPNKFTTEFLKNMGFNSSNDRAVLNLFKRLGFLTADGVPTGYYDQLRDKVLYKKALASRIRELYSDLFTINTEIYKETEANIKGAISRVTGGDEKTVFRCYSTFKTLCGIADFEPLHVVEQSTQAEKRDEHTEVPFRPYQALQSQPNLGFHYNIQIHLPATTDISVYNAIFKSLKDNLLI